MSLKWWEKTVEYKFVMDVANEESLILVPLDGDHEKAADTAIGRSDLWLMIEFKKDFAAIKSEIAKFVNYISAKEALISQDAHHHIVFGAIGKNEKQVDILKLNYMTYFSLRSNDLKSLLYSGKPLKEFNEYLKKLTAFKKTEKTGDGSMSIEDYVMVAGVTKAGKIVECISLSDFMRAHVLELQHDIENPIMPQRKGPEIGRR